MFLVGIATSSTVLAIAVFVLALQISSNIAQGPYQGYIPDLVPAGQVGLASGFVGLMIVFGNVVGYVVGAAAIATGAYPAATVGLGLLEVATMVILVTGTVDSTAHSPSRQRSWSAIAIAAWGRDVSCERPFIWFVASRLLVLTGGSVLTNLAPFYLGRTFGLTSGDAGRLLVALVGLVAIGTLASVIPAARLSDRLGRPPVITISCALGAAGLLVCAGAPTLPVAFAGAAIFGISTGAFLAVDWALLTELVPRAATGRFMGISNVASGSAGILAVALGGTTMDLVGGQSLDPSGPRAALVIGAACFFLGVVPLRQVRIPRQN